MAAKYPHKCPICHADYTKTLYVCDCGYNGSRSDHRRRWQQREAAQNFPHHPYRDEVPFTVQKWGDPKKKFRYEQSVTPRPDESLREDNKQGIVTKDKVSPVDPDGLIDLDAYEWDE